MLLETIDGHIVNSDIVENWVFEPDADYFTLTAKSNRTEIPVCGDISERNRISVRERLNRALSQPEPCQASDLFKGLI